MWWFLGFVASYLAARTFHWPLIWGIGLVTGIYLLATNGTDRVTEAVGGVGRTIGAFRHFVVGFVTFLLVGLSLNRLTGVDLGFAAPRFKALGISVWGWPAHTDLAVLLYLTTTAIAAVVAMQYVTGNGRNAKIIVLATWVIAFATIWTPRSVEEIRPKSSTPFVVAPLPAPATKWEDAEAALAEKIKAAKKRGVVGVVGEDMATILGGKSAPDLKEHGVVGSGVRRAWQYLFGEGEPEPVDTKRSIIPTSPPPPLPPPAPEPRELVMKRESPTPCTLYVGLGDHIRTGGRPVRVLFHGKEDWVLLSVGGLIPPEKFSPGEAQFASPEGEDGRPVLVQILSPVAK